VHVYRDMKQAKDIHLTGLRNAVTDLLDTYERFLGGDLVTALCLLREAADRERKHRAASSSDEPVTQMLPARAS
jgi:hypothetical protein